MRGLDHFPNIIDLQNVNGSTAGASTRTITCGCLHRPRPNGIRLRSGHRADWLRRSDDGVARVAPSPDGHLRADRTTSDLCSRQ